MTVLSCCISVTGLSDLKVWHSGSLHMYLGKQSCCNLSFLNYEVNYSIKFEFSKYMSKEILYQTSI